MPVCPPVIIGKTRTGSVISTDYPCQGWCGPHDFDGWRSHALQRVQMAISSSTISPADRQRVRGYLNDINEMSSNALDNRPQVTRLAAIVHWTDCLLRNEQDPPELPAELPGANEGTSITDVAKGAQRAATLVLLGIVLIFLVKGTSLWTKHKGK